MPFPLFEVQANAVAAAVTGRASLPPLAEREQWLRDEEESLRERSVDPTSRGAHVLGGRQWAYLKRLLQIASGPGVLPREPPGSTTAAGGGGRGRGEDRFSSRLGAVAQPGTAAVAAARGEGAGEDEPDAALQALLKMLSVKEAIYNDAGGNRPVFPGGPDDYRRRKYQVDWESGRFSVSYADRKANGEGPSAA